MYRNDWIPFRFWKLFSRTVFQKHISPSVSPSFGHLYLLLYLLCYWNGPPLSYLAWVFYISLNLLAIFFQCLNLAKIHDSVPLTTNHEGQQQIEASLPFAHLFCQNQSILHEVNERSLVTDIVKWVSCLELFVYGMVHHCWWQRVETDHVSNLTFLVLSTQNVQLTIILWAWDFYRVIFNQGAARVNYHA